MTVHESVRRENEALRMAHEGYSPNQISERTGLSRGQLADLLRCYPGAQRITCREDRCGQPQQGAGRPRAGWIQIKVTAQPSRWFCTWRCAGRHALTQDRKAQTDTREASRAR